MGTHDRLAPLLALASLLFFLFTGGCAPGIAASTPNSGLSALEAGIGPEDAIALVRGSDMVGRIDRSDAKLMALSEYLRLAGPILIHEGDPAASPIKGFDIGGGDSRALWVVAISGEVWPAGRIPTYFGSGSAPQATPYPPYRWAVVLIDAVPGSLIGVADAGIGTQWPSVFS